MLAVSLHAVRDELRNELVPLNRKYPIAELLEACRNYPGVSNAKRITFEYVMLKGVNDSIEDAKALVRLLKGIPAKINLIPFNPWPGSKYECSDWEQIEKFSSRGVRCRLCLAGAHAARPRHLGRLRPAQERDRKAFGARAHGAARHGDDGLRSTGSRLRSVNKIRAIRVKFADGISRQNPYCPPMRILGRIIVIFFAIFCQPRRRHRHRHRAARSAVAGAQRRSRPTRHFLDAALFATGFTGAVGLLPLVI